MAYPVVQARAIGTTPGTAVTSHPITLPSGIVAGELLFVIFAFNSASSSVTASAPSDWTHSTGVTTTSGYSNAVFYKYASGSDSLTVTTTAAEQSSHVSLRISGAAAPWRGSIKTSVGSHPDPNPATLPYMNLGLQTLWLVAYSMVGGNPSTTAPSGYTTNYTKSPGTGTDCASAATAERTSTSATENPGGFSTGFGGAHCVYTYAVPSVEGSITTLVDEFATLNTSQWRTDYSTGPVPAASGGQMVFTSSTTALASRMESRYGYNLTGNAVTVECPQIGDQSLTTLTCYPLRLFGSGTVSVSVRVTGGVLAFLSSSTAVYSTAYDAVAHRWLRIYERDKGIYFATSANGTSWVDRYSITAWPNQWSPFCVVPAFGVETSGAEASTTTMVIGSINGTTAPAANDVWVWNGTTEQPANVTVWNGTAEVAAGIEVT